MHYLIAPKAETGKLPIGCHVVADGEAISFEEPWSFGNPLIVRVNDAAALDEAKKALSGSDAFAVEGLIEPGPGAAFVIAAHLMRDTERFKPYAAAIPGVVQSFHGQFIARGRQGDADCGLICAGPRRVDRVPDCRRCGRILFL